MAETSWRTYEEVVRYVLADLQEHLDLSSVGPKTHLTGKSGIEWEIDATARTVDNESLIIVEARKRGGARINQEQVAAFAYRVRDTGATSGIIVTTIGLQKGAAKLAAVEGLTLVRLNPLATSENYIAQIADHLFAKFTERLTFTDSIRIEKRDANGNLYE